MIEMVKSAFNGLAKRLGFEVVPTWKTEGYELARHLAALFELLKVGCVLDVGANKGQYRNFLRMNVGYAGKIISFEPIEENVKILRERSESDNNWIIFDYALGSLPESLPLNVMARDVFSSFLEPNESQPSEFSRDNTVEKIETVEVKRLDDVIGQISAENDIGCFYLKMDTQGYDLEVMKGAKASLSRVLAVQSEVSIVPIYKDMPDYFTSLKFFNDHGFDLSGLFAVTRDKGLRVMEFDCVMINKNCTRT